MTLVEFLLDRIAEDEEEANSLPDPLDAPLSHLSPFPAMTPWQRNRLEASSEYVHCTVSKARVLTECKAKRRILYIAKSLGGHYEPDAGRMAPEIIRHLAVPYADHPAYRQEWKPDY